MARKVLTVQDLESAAAGGEIVVPRGTIVTPLAREEAELRGITIRFEDPAQRWSRGPAMAPRG